jgi:hypothetical protein
MRYTRFVASSYADASVLSVFSVVVDSSVLCPQAVQALVDPGDPVLIEKPVYAYAGTHHVVVVIFSKPDAS